MVFKGSLYILNLLCGIVPCEHQYPYPDVSPLGQVSELGNVSEFKGNGSLVRNGDIINGTDPLVVSTTTGKIRGYWMTVIGGRRIRAFEGIPYAEPPINEKRFRAPSPIKKWDGILDANIKGPKCLQYNDIVMSRVIGSENCLFLNIYAGVNVNNMKHPVIVYIHGGGFLTGSGGDFGPSYILQRDMILVTINYRLGVMGFMSTSDDESPGNSGLKDQSEAINWVYKNIKSFGGEPAKITLLGHGAGGTSVHMQMMSFQARGKFVAGISISGTAFNQWALHTNEQAFNLTKRFAKSLHCSIHGSTALIVNCLREKRGDDLVKMQIQFLDPWPLPLSLFRPVVEQDYQKEHPFLTESPEEAYRKGTVDMIPWICGQAQDEGYSFLISHLALGSFNKLRNNWDSLASNFLNYNDLPVDQEEITRRVNWFYFRRTSPRNSPMKTYSDALGARLIHTGVHKAIQAHSQYAETYGFVFGYKGKYNLGAEAGIRSSNWAVGHGEILGYILNSTTTYPGFRSDDVELVLSNILVNLIYNFASNQRPDFMTDTGEKYHIWNRITNPRNMSFLHIDKRIKMIKEPFLKQTLYWESLGLPDSLPLANFSSEIQNVSSPFGKGFVSTDITVLGGTVPDELKPPMQMDNENGTFFSNDVAQNDHPTISTLPTFVSLTSTSTATSTSENDNVRSPSLTTTTNPIRWLAQDYSPATPTIKPNLVYPTPESIVISVPTRIAPNQHKNSQLNTIPGSFTYTSEITKEGPHGVSIPIISGNLNPTFVTKSNITKDYLSSFGIKVPISDQESVDEDEFMIVTSNTNRYRKYLRRYK